MLAAITQYDMFTESKRIKDIGPRNKQFMMWNLPNKGEISSNDRCSTKPHGQCQSTRNHLALSITPQMPSLIVQNPKFRCLKNLICNHKLSEPMSTTKYLQAQLYLLNEVPFEVTHPTILIDVQNAVGLQSKKRKEKNVESFFKKLIIFLFFYLNFSFLWSLYIVSNTLVTWEYWQYYWWYNVWLCKVWQYW